jgi:hypothetical protein
MSDFGNMDRKAFAVTNIRNYDPSKPPEDGQDYLRSVVLEKRQKYSESVFLAPPEVLSALPKKRVTILDQFASLWQSSRTYQPAPPHLKPSEEWERKCLEDFACVRADVHESEREKEYTMRDNQPDRFTPIDVMAMLRAQFEDEEEEEAEEDEYEEYDLYEENSNNFNEMDEFAQYDDGGEEGAVVNEGLNAMIQRIKNSDQVQHRNYNNDYNNKLNNNSNRNQNNNNSDGNSNPKKKKKTKNKNKKKAQQSTLFEYDYENALSNFMTIDDILTAATTPQTTTTESSYFQQQHHANSSSSAILCSDLLADPEDASERVSAMEVELPGAIVGGDMESFGELEGQRTATIGVGQLLDVQELKRELMEEEEEYIEGESYYYYQVGELANNAEADRLYQQQVEEYHREVEAFKKQQQELQQQEYEQLVLKHQQQQEAKRALAEQKMQTIVVDEEERKRTRIEEELAKVTARENENGANVIEAKMENQKVEEIGSDETNASPKRKFDDEDEKIAEGEDEEEADDEPNTADESTCELGETTTDASTCPSASKNQQSKNQRRKKRRKMKQKAMAEAKELKEVAKGEGRESASEDVDENESEKTTIATTTTATNATLNASSSPHFNDQTGWRALISAHDGTCDRVRRLDQVTTCRVISYILQWAKEREEVVDRHGGEERNEVLASSNDNEENSGMSHSNAIEVESTPIESASPLSDVPIASAEILSTSEIAWLYHLFARLSEPLPRSTSADLRELMIVCSRLRAATPSLEDALAQQLNALITIITKYFGQVEMK